MTLTTVAVADDQALVRSGMCALLATFPDVDVVLEVADAEALLDGLARTRVAVVLCDVRMPAIDGFEVIRRLRARGNGTPVILLTTFPEPHAALRAASAGAQGFMLKDASASDLYDAIVRVARGETLLAPVATDTVRARFAYRDQAPPRDDFNEREVAILRLIAGGYSNAEIARTVHLAPGTVKNYVSEILEKLGARDRTQAVLKAITLRVI